MPSNPASDVEALWPLVYEVHAEVDADRVARGLAPYPWKHQPPVSLKKVAMPESRGVPRACGCGCGQAIPDSYTPTWKYIKGHKPKSATEKTHQPRPDATGCRPDLNYRMALGSAQTELQRLVAAIEAIDDDLEKNRAQRDLLQRLKDDAVLRHGKLEAALPFLESL